MLISYLMLSFFNCHDFELAMAVMSVETNFRNVISKEGSVGVMQVRVSTAKMIKCEAKSIDQLMNEELNIKCGCKYLKMQADRYSNVQDVIASYNAGSAIICRSGVLKSGNRCVVGKYINQDYVDKVMRKYNEFQKF